MTVSGEYFQPNLYFYPSKFLDVQNKLAKLLAEKPSDILSVFFTAGYPKLEDTAEVLLSLQDSGVDLVEIGMPFSDPIADGPTIQESNNIAIRNGITIEKIFEQLESIKDQIKIPILLMGYINPVVQYGVDAFVQKCAEIGISGTILPDLPMIEYKTVYQYKYEENNLVNIFLVTPQTTAKRIKDIDSVSKGFIYMVSTAGTTGARKGINDEQISYFKRVNAMNLTAPRIVGFGISDNKSFQKACEYASGAIIGSAFINLLRDSKDLSSDINRFIKGIKTL